MAPPSIAAADLMPHHVPLSALPPSFEGNAWAYAFALFGLTLVSFLSLKKLLSVLTEARRERAIERKVGVGFTRRPAILFWTPLGLFRWKISCLYVCILMGASGDVLVMLLWREVSARTMEFLLAFDRALDGATIVPFMLAFMIGEWSDQAIPHALIRVNEAVRPPKWDRVKGSVGMTGLIGFIALGVTIGKAWK
ncbi:hypothetical protein [Novosphingobium sp. AP12]|uniref:hypothetical protein n=1 Tax=Novosphingobium sp. AP12 TaxID=1144305 RepID=UPI000271DDF3|nr:hypothetical protein [Novosphingobium sp. AP12]EJL21885.1 hypothetical protein PMI02_04870 [Novosphingobium sp. AP12]